METIKPEVKTASVPQTLNKTLKVFQCDCFSEAIASDIDEYGVCISFWKRGFYPKNLGLSERIRWQWHILTKGYPWTDEIILDQKTANEFADDIKNKITSYNIERVDNGT